MPVMDGIQAARLIRTECLAVGVIDLSLFGEPEQAATMRDNEEAQARERERLLAKNHIMGDVMGDVLD